MTKLIICNMVWRMTEVPFTIALLCTLISLRGFVSPLAHLLINTSAILSFGLSIGLSFVKVAENLFTGKMEVNKAIANNWMRRLRFDESVAGRWKDGPMD